ncbi:glycosyltransferase [Gammaproteobacteria bacterium]|nr:glycosyltransferase [Gammaproteobacteria bacterium]
MIRLWRWFLRKVWLVLNGVPGIGWLYHRYQHGRENGPVVKRVGLWTLGKIWSALGGVPWVSKTYHRYHYGRSSGPLWKRVIQHLIRRLLQLLDLFPFSARLTRRLREGWQMRRIRQAGLLSLDVPADCPLSVDAPRISIVILNLDRLLMTLECVQNLINVTRDFPFELVVVDNGSPDFNRVILARYQPLIRLVALGENRYFGEGNNIGAEAARGEFLIFLNNDAFPRKGWLGPLVQALGDGSQVGMAGPKFVFPDGRLQEAGSLLRADGSADMLGRFGDADDPAHGNDRDVDYVSAACVAVRRQHFIDVGGFDPIWEPAYYEDSDLALRLRARGLITRYVAASRVMHIENGTSSDARYQLGSIVSLNCRKFVDRWQPFLISREESELRRCAEAIALPVVCRDAGDEGRPKIHIHTPFRLAQGGGEKYLLSIAAALSGHYHVTLTTNAPYSQLRMRHLQRVLGINLSGVRLCALDQIDRRDFVLEVSMGHGVVAPIASQDGVPHIYHCQFPFPSAREWVERLARTRRARHDRIASVVVNSQFTADAYAGERQRRGFASPHPLAVIAPPVAIDRFASVQRQPMTAHEPFSILVIGRFFSDGHCKNQHLAIEALRRLDQLQPGRWKLDLVGSVEANVDGRTYVARCLEAAQGLPVAFHLDASESQLLSLCAQASQYWHLTGLEVAAADQHRLEHFGITVVEAMAAGILPLVVDRGGPAEILRDCGLDEFRFGSLEALVALAIEHPEQRVDANRLRAAATKYSAEHFARQWRERVSQSCLTDVAAVVISE